MATIKSLKKNLDKRAKRLFTGRRMLEIAAFVVLTKSMILTWVVWDSILSVRLYQQQNIKEHLLRVARFAVGISWFAGFLNPLYAGIMLMADGAYSIFRYRRMGVTKHFIEDVPRIVRIVFGMSLTSLIPGLSLLHFF